MRTYIFFCILPDHTRLYITGIKNVVSEDRSAAAKPKLKADDVDETLVGFSDQFAEAWADTPHYSELSIWRGSTFKEITLSYEEVPP